MSDSLAKLEPSTTPGGRGDHLRRALHSVLSYVTLALYALLAPWGYAFFAFMVMCPAGNRLKRRARLQQAIRTGFRAMHGWLRTLGLVVVRTPDVDANRLPQPCVVIANHPTHLDITAILSWLPNSCTIVKRSIYRQWWLTPLMEGSGQIEGAGSHPLDAARLIERAGDQIRSGLNLVVFPEGTRTETGPMTFHRLAFEVACRTNVPVVPLRITCDPPYLSKNRSTLRPPRRAPTLIVEVLDTLWPRDQGGDSRRLRDRARSLYSCEAP